MPDAKPPTVGEIANVLRIRDEVARRIHNVGAHPNRTAKEVAEKLIADGFIAVAAVHRAIIDDDDLF